MPAQWSGDGKWYWDGTRWHCAISADGAWRYTGQRWEPWTGGPAGPMPPAPYLPLNMAPAYALAPALPGPPAGVPAANPAGPWPLPLGGGSESRNEVWAVAVQTLAVYRRNLLGLVLVALPGVAALGMVMIAADAVLGLADQMVAFMTVHPNPAAKVAGPDFHRLAWTLAGFGAACLTGVLVLCPLTLGALCLASARAIEGRPLGIAECYSAATRRYPQLLGNSLVMVVAPIAVLAGFTLFAVITGLRFAILGQLLVALTFRFGLAPAAIMLDGLGMVASLRRSWAVTEGRRFFALAFLVVLAVCAVGLPPALVAGLPAGAGTTSATLHIGEVAGTLTGAVSAPVAAVMLTVAYLRWRRSAPKPSQ